MKKSLLFLSLASTAIALHGAELKEPKFLSNYAIQAISPNGKWAASSMYGYVTLINIETGEETTFQPDESGVLAYDLGTGNVLSDNGIMLCSTSYSSTPTYYEKGEWKELPCDNLTNSGANGITPDGSRICGDLGLHEMTQDDVTMVVPVIWDRKADGTYGDYVLLPHPTTDFFGRAPQYIKAISISDDGHTVVGQITDCRGFFLYPIVYTEGADGKWSYSLPTEPMTNPNHVELPAEPGESPKEPSATEFMSEEKQAEYWAAYEAWQETYDPAAYPEPTDYLTTEQLAQYNDAMATYQTAYEKWNKEWMAYNDAYWEILLSSPNGESNQVALNPAGTQIAITVTGETPNEDPELQAVQFYNVWTIDLDGSTVTKYDNPQLYVKAYGVDYVLATEIDDTGCYNGYLLKDGKATSLYDYLCSKGETIKEWVDLNMTHTVELMDWETEQVIYETYTFTGLPVASRDMSVLASWTLAAWGDFSPESYLFFLPAEAGINEATVDHATVTFDAAGNLSVGADVAAIEVYDLAGIRLMHVVEPASTVACDLAHGIYIVKTTYTDGTTVTSKTAR